MLLARFDSDALRPPPAEPTRADERDRAVQVALAAWARERLDQPFAASRLVGTDPARARRVADALARDLDGSDRLDTLSPLAGRLWRVRIKLAEALPARAARPGDVWDAGSVIDTPAGLDALARFVPRRPTLVVADGLDDARLGRVLEAIEPRAPTFTRPVRLLVLVRKGAAPPLTAATRQFALDDA